MNTTDFFLLVYLEDDFHPFQNTRASPPVPYRYNPKIPLRNPDGLSEGHNRRPRFPQIARMIAGDAGEGYYSIHALFLSSENCHEITEG